MMRMATAMPPTREMGIGIEQHSFFIFQPPLQKILQLYKI